MCEYCNNPVENKPISKNSIWEVELMNWNNQTLTLYITFDNRNGYEGSYGEVEVDINYCPMCGRDLKGV